MPLKSSTTEWIWFDNKLIRWQDATIHVMSHVVHYGSSVFEGLRCYRTPDGPSLFRLDAHIRRLIDSCRVFRIDLPYDHLALSLACQDLIRANGLEECYVRPVVFCGEGSYGLDHGPCTVETFIACWPWESYLGEEGVRNGIDVCVSSWFRPAPNTHPAMAKLGGNYLNAQLIKLEATANGYDEAIALGPSGLVSEGSGQNVFWVRDGELFTPPADGSLLPGITRESVMTLAKDAGLTVSERLAPRETLYVADEIFLTGTASEITPVRSVDRIAVGDGTVGPVTRYLQEQYPAIARGHAPDPYGWRTALRPSSEAGAAC